MLDSRLIAIVDDDAPLLAALGNLVRSAGHRTVLFESAEACIDGVSGLGVELVLSDFGMPGANGVELMRMLRRNGCPAPVVIMTAQPYEEVARAAVPAGAFAVLAKPFDEDDLLDAIDLALGEAAPPGAGATP